MLGTIIFIPHSSGPVIVEDVPWPMPLETMQALVQCYVQAFPIIQGKMLGWCNEDGWAMRLPMNFVASLTFGRTLLGNVYVTGWLDPMLGDAAPAPDRLAVAYKKDGGRTSTIEKVLESINGKAE